MTQKLYTLEDQYVVVEEGSIVSPKLLLRDRHWEGFSEGDVKTVFEYSYTELVDKLANYHDLNRVVTQSQERELMFLLETIMRSRHLLRKTEKD